MLFTKTISLVKAKPSSAVGLGYQYVTHQYKFLGVTYFKRDEILALSPE